MAEPSWRQLSMIPESVLKASVIKACGIEDVPAAGVNRQFDGGRFQVYATVAPTMHLPDGIRYTLYQDGGTKSFDTHKEVLKVVKAAKGTPTGDALRAFFQNFLAKP
jgi:hypothetical protein